MGISLLLPTVRSIVSWFPTAPWHTRRLHNCLFRRKLMATEAITWISDRIWRIRLPDQQTRQVYHLTRWVIQTYCHEAMKGLIISLRTDNKRPRQHRYLVTRGLIWCSIGWCYYWFIISPTPIKSVGVGTGKPRDNYIQVNGMTSDALVFCVTCASTNMV